MQSIEPVRRLNVSETVADALRAMIVDGRLGPGERVNEVRLAHALGVSRTPLREALSRLLAEGAVASTPAIGYWIRPLTAEECGQLYDIRPLLDPEALRLSGVPSPARLAKLEGLNRRFAAARDGERAIALDDQWHLALIAECANRVLVEMIQAIMLRTRRYELALLREEPNRARSGEDHGRILAALSAGDLTAACAALKINMESGRAPIMAWLSRRGEAGAAA